MNDHSHHHNHHHYHNHHSQQPFDLSVEKSTITTMSGNINSETMRMSGINPNETLSPLSSSSITIGTTITSPTEDLSLDKEIATSETSLYNLTTATTSTIQSDHDDGMMMVTRPRCRTGWPQHVWALELKNYDQ